MVGRSSFEFAACLRTRAQLTMAATYKISWDKLKYYPVTLAQTPESATARACSSSSIM